MSESRLTFFEPTNFNLPVTIFNTLIEDAFIFGYIKNNKANVSGLLNHLIPNLTEYRKDLHESFVKANNGDELFANKIEENIYKIYFNKYDYCDDAFVSVPFRVNKEHMQDFLNIVDKHLYSLNIDFTGFVRSLLVEYCSKRFNQREYFFYYKEINKIKYAILNSLICHFYLENKKTTFTPISVELSRISGANVVVGFDTEDGCAHVLPISKIKKLVVADLSAPVTYEETEFAYDFFLEDEKEEEDEK